MIQIAPSTLRVDFEKIEEAVKMVGSAIFDEDNPRDVIIKMKELAKKFEES